MSISGNKSYSNNNIAGSSLSNTFDQNTSSIVELRTKTTGITYDVTTDKTTIDNNILITKNSKCSFIPVDDDDITNKLYCDDLVNTQIANLINSAPASLNTLYELASALGDENFFSTTIINNLATKASLEGSNIMSNATNIFYGDGSNLTGVLKELPSALMYRNLIQTITALHTYNVIL